MVTYSLKTNNIICDPHKQLLKLIKQILICKEHKKKGDINNI
jgi:hypothetical protein